MANQVITTNKVKDMRGRIEGFSADFRGRFESGTCQDKQTAESRTLAAMCRAAEYADKRRYFFAADGLTVYCLFYNDGWMVDIIGPDRSFPSSWICGRDTTFEQMSRRIREHLTAAYGGVTKEN
jgi:hypothetical protein